jgi:carbon storage regulator
MLVLSRKFNENIVIGDDIIVKVVRLEGDVVKLGIQAPPSVSVHRQEVYDEILRTNKTAVTKGRRAVPRISPASPLPRTKPGEVV